MDLVLEVLYTMDMKSEFLKKLQKTALEQTIPFCMNCYSKEHQDNCSNCDSDDLARWMDGIGLDWNLNFAMEHILREKLISFNPEQEFEEMVRSCYSDETIVGWMKFNTCELLKSQDPISWRIARDEYIDELIAEEKIFSFDNGSTYYWTRDLEKF